MVKMVLNKGIELERKVHEYFLKRGYFVKPQLNIILDAPEGERQVITDIDVFGIKIDSDLHIKRLCADCKHEETGFSQIIRLVGLRQIFEFDECFAVRERITKEVRYFGNKLGINLFEKDFFDIQKDTLNYGSSTIKTYERTQELISKISQATNREIKRKYLFQIQRTILEKDSFKRFKILRIIINELLIDLNGADNEKKEILEWILFDAYAFATIALIEITIALQDCPSKYLLTELESRTKEGYLPEKTKGEIFKMLENLNSILKKSNINISQNTLSFDSKPTFLIPLKELIDLLNLNKNLFQKLLLTNDLITYGFILHKIKPAREQIIKQNILNQDALQTLSRINIKIVEVICDKKEHFSNFSHYF